ncbi:hypothetical protein [Maricaulis sp.]|uniref:hypothetical protein n=1 Tax=Maricaulis sp. TaxID=1486257 RepID=UPI0025BA08E1|nr:hypothetical protein [Maricaulis sp.]
MRNDVPAIDLVCKFTELDAISVKAALKDGNNPMLRLQDLPGQTRGCFDPNNAGTITLDSGLLQKWNAAPQDPALRDLVLATCLHELVHWGRHKSGAPAHLCANASGAGPCMTAGCGRACSQEAGHAFEAEWAGLKQSLPPAPGAADCHLMKLESTA